MMSIALDFCFRRCLYLPAQAKSGMQLKIFICQGIWFCCPKPNFMF